MFLNVFQRVLVLVSGWGLLDEDAALLAVKLQQVPHFE
jgi:hypothetical protein